MFVNAFVLLLGEEFFSKGRIACAEVNIVIGVGIFGESSNRGSEIFSFLIENDIFSGLVKDVSLIGAAGEGAFIEFEEHGRSFFTLVGARSNVGDNVIDGAVVELYLHRLSHAAVNEIFGDEGVPLTAVRAD